MGIIYDMQYEELYRRREWKRKRHDQRVYKVRVPAEAITEPGHGLSKCSHAYFSPLKKPTNALTTDEKAEAQGS
jgi:hypothetical protein